MKLLLSLFCLAALTLLAPPCRSQTPETPAPNVKIAGGKKSFTVPFELVDNRIFVKVKLNGRGPYHFLIDTGGYASVSMNVARELKLPMGYESRGQGAGQNVVVARETKIAEIQLGDLRISNQEAYASTAYADTRHVFGSKPFDGVLGLPLFQKMVVKVDYERGRLTFTEASSFKYEGTGVVVPFELDRFAPVVRGELDGVAGRFTIDTGARSSLLLRGPFVEGNGLRAKYAPKVEAVTGWGNGGPIRSQVTRARVLRLGQVEARDPVMLFSLQKSGLLATVTSDAGLVGAGVLKQFNITFDYDRSQLIFEKNRNYGKADPYDRAGLWLSQSADGQSFEVFDVVAGGPADQAGLKVGDRVLSLDGKPAAHIVLPSLREQLKTAPPNRRVRLLVQSGGDRREVVLTLKELV